MLFDTLLIIFRILTYILIIVFSFKFKEHIMPYTAASMNFAWQLNAVIKDVSSGFELNYSFIGHVIWLLLDVIIIALSIVYTTNKTRIYIGSTLIVFSTLLFIFANQEFMFISAFAIDLIMAVLFLMQLLYDWKTNKNVKHILKSYLRAYLLIGLSKLFGDLFAWLTNREFSVVVDIIGILVLVINSFYVLTALFIFFNNKRRIKSE